MAASCPDNSQQEAELRRRKEELEKEKQALRGIMQDFFTKVDKKTQETAEEKLKRFLSPAPLQKEEEKPPSPEAVQAA